MRLAKKTSNLFRPRAASSAPGLDVSGLTGVISVDPVARTADVQGMCTYEDLVDATLPHGLIPYVVPQLRTITLGGAVTGLGIESTSFRNGLPHESVLEMDVFTGSGEVVTTRPGDELFDAFPNSYGSLGYATRLRISLEAVPAYVALRHLRFDDAALLAKTIEAITESGEHDGQRVDGLDGVQRPLVRRLWPRRWRRSDVYHRLIGLDERLGIVRRLDARAGRPLREKVIQDIEVPVERLADFLAWFDEAVGMRPVWLCPLRAQRAWSTYPLVPGETYVNVGFWGTVHVGPEAPEGPMNRAIEAMVHELGGHKSLYSEAFYDRETFDLLYQADQLAAVKAVHDPQDRLTSLYDKAVKKQ